METGLFRELEHHLKQGRDHEALQLVHIELSKTPNDWNSLYLVAWVYRSLDRYAEAEEYYKKSLAVKSDAYPTHLGLGITYQLMEDYEASLRSLKQATHLNPRYVDAYNSLGISLEGLNRHNEAFDAYSKAATILTEDTYSQVEKDGGGWLLVERSAEGHQVGIFNAERLSRVHEWLRSTSLFSIVRNNMGRCLAMLGYSNEARKMFAEAIEFTPDGVDFYTPYEGLEKLREGDLG